MPREGPGGPLRGERPRKVPGRPRAQRTHGRHKEGPQGPRTAVLVFAAPWPRNEGPGGPRREQGGPRNAQDGPRESPRRAQGREGPDASWRPRAQKPMRRDKEDQGEPGEGQGRAQGQRPRGSQGRPRKAHEGPRQDPEKRSRAQRPVGPVIPSSCLIIAAAISFYTCCHCFV